MTHPKTVNIAYPDNQLTQRFIGSRQVQGKELEFFMSDGAVITGFVTGLDDDSVQLCTLPGLTATLLSTMHIVQIKETGGIMDDLPGSQADEVKKFTKIFRRVSERELSRDTDDN